MQLKKVVFLNINELKEGYKYIYGAFGRSFFKNQYYKINFLSHLPNYWWSDIQKIMLKKGIFFEDVLGKEAKNIEMGLISCTPFTDEDVGKYSKNLNHWIHLRDKAVDEQMRLVDQYRQLHGSPDISGFSLFNT